MTQALQKPPKEDRSVEYIPFGTDSKIKLSIAIVQQQIAKRTKSGLTCTESDAIRFVMLCQARALNPFEGDAFLIGFDSKDGPQFNIVTGEQAFLKRAEASSEYDGMESGIIVRDESGNIADREGTFYLKGEQVVGGWCAVHFKTKKYPQKERIRIEPYANRIAAGPLWESNPERMIQKCFDPETEILTTRGFEKFPNAEGRILQVGENGLEETDAVPFVQSYDGRMIKYENEHLDFCVTPNHDMITTAGKIQANDLFLKARARPKFFIPRTISVVRGEAPIPDRSIRLAAAFIADGTRVKAEASRFSIAVSRPKKIQWLEGIGGYVSKRVIDCAGNQTETASRTIVTLERKTSFRFEFAEATLLVDSMKRINATALLSLSRRQARLFVDTLIFFDGYVSSMGVKRFYTSNRDTLSAFEIACVAAGYSVSPPMQRVSDISSKPGFVITVSNRCTYPIRKVGPSRTDRPGITESKNASGKVWCVTVPSGKIIVRRKGFSFVCGNCAEAAALRKAFPTKLGGLYSDAEVQTHEDRFRAAKPTVAVAMPSEQNFLTEPVSVPPETGYAPAAPPPTHEPPAPVTPPEPTPYHTQLVDWLKERNIPEETFWRWLTESKLVPNADSLSTISEIPVDIVARLMKARDGMLKGIKELT